jgi:hypothetical protein
MDSPPTSQEPNIGPQSPAVARALEAAAEAMGRLRFGQVLMTVHDCKLVQLEVT